MSHFYNPQEVLEAPVLSDEEFKNLYEDEDEDEDVLFTKYRLNKVWNEKMNLEDVKHLLEIDGDAYTYCGDLNLQERVGSVKNYSKFLRTNRGYTKTLTSKTSTQKYFGVDRAQELFEKFVDWHNQYSYG